MNGKRLTRVTRKEISRLEKEIDGHEASCNEIVCQLNGEINRIAIRAIMEYYQGKGWEARFYYSALPSMEFECYLRLRKN